MQAQPSSPKAPASRGATRRSVASSMGHSGHWVILLISLISVSASSSSLDAPMDIGRMLENSIAPVNVSHPGPVMVKGCVSMGGILGAPPDNHTQLMTPLDTSGYHMDCVVPSQTSPHLHNPSCHSGTSSAPQGAWKVQLDYTAPAPTPSRFPLPSPARSCPTVPWPFHMEPGSAAGPDFLIRCLPSGQVYLPSIDVIITGFGPGFITIDRSLYARARHDQSRAVSVLNLTGPFTLAPTNALHIIGSTARGLVADSKDNMMPLRINTAPLGQSFAHHVTLVAWGAWGGAYLRGPNGTCTWDGGPAPPLGACGVQLDYIIPLTMVPASTPSSPLPSTRCGQGIQGVMDVAASTTPGCINGSGAVSILAIPEPESSVRSSSHSIGTLSADSHAGRCITHMSASDVMQLLHIGVCAALAHLGWVVVRHRAKHRTHRRCKKCDGKRESKTHWTQYEAISGQTMSFEAFDALSDRGVPCVAPDTAEPQAWTAGEQPTVAGRPVQPAEQPAKAVDPAVALENVQRWQPDEVTMECKLGSGGFGTVWRGLLSGNPVALKCCKSPDDHDLMREAGMMAGLDHPNLVSMQGITTRGDMTDGIVLQYMTGGTLAQVLSTRCWQQPQQPSFFNRQQRCHIALQVCRGVSYLHSLSHPFVHLDLKPDNLLLQGSGDDMVVKIADFGISQYADTTSTSNAGTAMYMAPEVAKCRPDNPWQVSVKADVWSVGMLLEPFHATSDDDVRDLLETDGIHLRWFEFPEEYGFEPEWQELVSDCLQLDPDSRPTLPELVQRLEVMVASMAS